MLGFGITSLPLITKWLLFGSLNETGVTKLKTVELMNLGLVLGETIDQVFKGKPWAFMTTRYYRTVLILPARHHLFKSYVKRLCR